MIVNLIVLPITFISNIWFPITGMPAALQTIAGIFPIKALAAGLQYVFDPRHHGAGFDWRRSEDAGDLDRDRDLPDAAFPAQAAGGVRSEPELPAPARHYDLAARTGTPPSPSRSARAHPGSSGVGPFILAPIVDAFGAAARVGARALCWSSPGRSRSRRSTSRWCSTGSTRMGCRRSTALAGVQLALAVRADHRRSSDLGLSVHATARPASALIVAASIGFPAVLVVRGDPDRVDRDRAARRRYRGGVRRQRRRGRAAADADARSARSATRSWRRRAPSWPQTAVAAERERFARDLHDLLGHSAVGDRDQGRAGRAAAAGIARARRRRGRRGGGGGPPGAQRGAPGRVAGTGSRRSPKELEGARVALSAAGIDASSSSARRSRWIPRSRRCWPGPCARARPT